VFKNRELRRLFGPKVEEVGENFIMCSFIIFNPRQIILG
jgi:hypothetical protein